MPDASEAAAAHRRFGIEFNNLAWDLIEQSQRSAAENDHLLDLAHASFLHWGRGGKPINLQRGLCLLANAYLAVADPLRALHYAERCLAMSAQPGADQTDFDRATACDCAARAHVGLGHADEARHFRALALGFAARLEDQDERKVFDQMLSRADWRGIA